jgi:hypothetical protein
LPALPCIPVPISVKDGGLIVTDGGSSGADGGSAAVPPGADFAAFGVSPNVAVGMDGNAIVSFWESPNGWVRRYVNGQWMQPELIGIADGPVAVAAGPAGAAIAVYYEKRADLFAICARVFTPNLGWSDPTSMGTASQGWWQDPVEPLPRVGMDGAGNAVVAWSTNAGWTTRVVTKGAIAVRRYTPNSGWGALEPFSVDPLGAVVLAVTPQGRALVAWTTGVPDSSVVGIAFDPGTGWGNSEVIAAQGTQPALAAEADGDIWAAWVHYRSPTEFSIETSRRDVTGTWSAVTALATSNLGTDSGPGSPSFVDIQSGGVGVDAAAWSNWGSSCSFHSDVSVRDPSRGWLPEQEILGNSGEPVELSAVGVSRTGEALVLLHDVASGLGGCVWQETYARWYRPGRGWLPAVLLDDSTDYARIAMAPDGRALVVGTSESSASPFALINTTVARWLEQP